MRVGRRRSVRGHLNIFALGYYAWHIPRLPPRRNTNTSRSPTPPDQVPTSIGRRRTALLPRPRSRRRKIRRDVCNTRPPRRVSYTHTPAAGRASAIPQVPKVPCHRLASCRFVFPSAHSTSCDSPRKLERFFPLKNKALLTTVINNAVRLISNSPPSPLFSFLQTVACFAFDYATFNPPTPSRLHLRSARHD
jgi:hypothetical protein